MDERFNLTPRQLRLIQKMNRYNECRISNIAARNAAVLVVRDVERQEYLVLKIARLGKIELISVFEESDSAVGMFQHMLSTSSYRTFLDLLKLARADKTITRSDMVHFSMEQLISLCNVAMDELVQRAKVQVFVTDKVARGKELLEASAERELDALGKAFASALEDLESSKNHAELEGD